MLILTPRLRQYLDLIEGELSRVLPAASQKPQRLHQAMRYSVFAGGKRIRPLLCVTAATSRSTVPAALRAAAALECLHTYTLIHDDLPAMDDDTLRRGKPTSHVVFGEATAILAGDALLTLAFELLATVKPKAPYTAADIIKLVAGKAGSRGVVGGQAEDMYSEGNKPTSQQLAYIHQHKTADLITASLMCGAMIAGSPSRKLKLYSKLGDILGNSFQLTDDLLNETSTQKKLGKAVKTDAQKKKLTAVRLWGIAKTSERITQLFKDSERVLAELKLEGTPLHHLTRGILARDL